MKASSSAISLCILGAASALAQPVRRVPDEPMCRACSVRLRRVAVLGDDTGAGEIVGQPRVVARDRRGRVVIALSGRAPQVYDSTGKFLRVLGDIGAGPGEFKLVDAIEPGEGDSLLVYDSALQRTSLFDPGLQFVRSWPREVRLAFNALGLTGSISVVAGLVQSPERFGQPLHLVGRDGKVRRSFGADLAGYRPERAEDMRRLLAPADGGGFWSANTLTYRLERWAATGERRETLVRDAPWFPPSDGSAPVFTRDRPPPSVVLGLHQPRSRLLFVAVGRAKADWWKGLGERRIGPNGTEVYDIRDITMVNESWVEVIDVEMGRVLARVRTPGLRLSWVLGDLVAGYMEDDRGIGRVVLAHWDLVGE